MLHFLIPVLIASQGGRMVGGDRGRVMGAIAVMGTIAGVATYDTNGGILVGQPMLMGAMAIGPFAGWVIKKFDQAMDGHMPAGFEMLINNFSVGILGMCVAILGYFAVAPLMAGILAVLTAGVNVLVNAHLLPLAAIFIEPAKVLFLNNAINHGVFTPIAASQAEQLGKSIMYLLEPNPGPGLGVLIAYMLFCKDSTTKASAPGAIIIHFLGGIHEIYFPYILMNPVVIVAPIAGNIAAILFYTIFNVGLVGAPSPGSIIALTLMAPRNQLILVWLGVAIAAGISFLIAAPIVRSADVKSLDEAQSEMASMKAEAKGTATAVTNPGEVKKVVFACDAGMGSSAMGATKFRNRVKAVRPDLTVINTSVDNIPADCDIAVVQTTLVDRAKKSAPQAQMVTIGNFLADPNLDALYVQLTTGDAPAPVQESNEVTRAVAAAAPKKKVLSADGIKLGLKSVTKEEAIQAAGELMTKLGYVDASYVDAMQEREKLVTTYMGMGIAIPHGTTQAKGTVKKTGIVVLQYPDGVSFGDEKAQLVFGIAGIGDEHLDLLAKICETLEDEELLEKMKTTNSIDFVLTQLS
jgi:PTS system mannitol-specific IIC component